MSFEDSKQIDYEKANALAKELFGVEDIRRLDPLLSMIMLMQVERLTAAINRQKTPEKRIDLVEDSLGSVAYIGRERWEADTDVQFSNQWSRSFVHGADTLLPAGKMIESLLEEGETVPRIDSLRWKNLMTQNMRFTVGLKPFGAEDEKDSLMTASFTTSMGRTFYLKGDGNGQPIRKNADRNPLAQEMFAHTYRTMPNDGQWSDYPIRMIAPGQEDKKLSLPLTMNTAIEMINHAMLKCGDMEQYHTSRLRLFLGVKNFALPDIEAVSTVRLRVLHEKVRGSEKGFKIIPVEVEYLDERGQKCGGGMSMFAFPKDEVACENFLMKKKQE